MEKVCPRCGTVFTHSQEEQVRTVMSLNDEQRDFLVSNYGEKPLCLCCLKNICETDHPVTIRDLSAFLLEYASCLMSSGAHTSRVVRNITRIAESFGYKVDMTVFLKHITMTLFCEANDSIRRTSVRTIGSYAFNFSKISQLSSLSWSAYDDHLPFETLKVRYEAIAAEKPYSPWVVLLLVSVANASFCRLFGGDPVAMGVVLVATLVGFFVRQRMTAERINQMAVFIVSAFVASMTAAPAVWLGWGTTPQTALATSVLFLIPGVPLINSILDIIEGHVLIGISRSVNALILIVCIALGLSATLLMLDVKLL